MRAAPIVDVTDPGAAAVRFFLRIVTAAAPAELVLLRPADLVDHLVVGSLLATWECDHLYPSDNHLASIGARGSVRARLTGSQV